MLDVQIIAHGMPLLGVLTRAQWDRTGKLVCWQPSAYMSVHFTPGAKEYHSSCIARRKVASNEGGQPATGLEMYTHAAVACICPSKLNRPHREKK
jgi:hypothetical protein